jgi:hypothetical protein
MSYKTKSFRLAALQPPRQPSPAVDSFAFKSRPNFVPNAVRDLSTNVRDLSAMTLQQKKRTVLANKGRQSAN